MYLLYLDESGTHGIEASYFVLAGLAVFEREIHWFSQDLDMLQQDYFPKETDLVHFHATKLRAREGGKIEPPWDQLSAEKRYELKNRVFDIIRNRQGVLFACAVERKFAEDRGEDLYERAFEDLISRFDMFLRRRNQQAVVDGKEEQRGLVVLAESSIQRTIGLLARCFQVGGTRWGQSHNVTDIPLFAPAKETRMLQYADFCSNATYGRYHGGMTKDFDKIAPKFDQDGGVIHGLSHLTTDFDCACIACFSRRGRSSTTP